MSDSTPRPVEAYISVGSNIDPRPNTARALAMLSQRMPLTGVSSFRRTESIGPDGQPDGGPEFINGVVRVLVACVARSLKFDILRPIEASLGRADRNRAARFAPRTIDLDVVLYGEAVIDEPDLRIPSPDVERPFVAAGLLELEPELVLPGSGVVLSCLAGGSKWPGMTVDAELTAKLRELCSR